MSAATSGVATAMMAGLVLALGIAASTTLYEGTLICSNSSGYAVNGADTDGLRFQGVAGNGHQDLVNTAANGFGSNGDLKVEVNRTGVYKFACTGMAADDINKPVYVVDNQTVGLASQVSNHVFVGVIREFVSATEVWVEIQPGKQDPARRTFQVEVVGANADDIDLTTVAAEERVNGIAGADFYVKSVKSVLAVVTSTGNFDDPARQVETTHWTLAAGVIASVGDESANTLIITMDAVLVV